MAKFWRDFQALPGRISKHLKNEIKEQLFNFILSLENRKSDKRFARYSQFPGACFAKSQKLLNFANDFEALPDGIFQMLKMEIKEKLFNFILS